MALRKLREVIPDGQRPVSRRLELNGLKKIGNYGCSDGCNWERVVGEQTAGVEGWFCK